MKATESPGEKKKRNAAKPKLAASKITKESPDERKKRNEAKAKSAASQIRKESPDQKKKINTADAKAVASKKATNKKKMETDEEKLQRAKKIPLVSMQ